MGLPPSDQSEWLWQSPRRRLRNSAARPLRAGVASVFEMHEVGGRFARHGLGDDLGRGVPHAGEVGEAARRGPLGQDRGVDLVDRGGGTSEGTDFVGLGPLGFEQVGDASESDVGIHHRRG